MSDTRALPPPESPPEPEPEPAAPPPPRNLLPWLTAVGFLILAVGLLLVWRHPAMQPPSGQPASLEKRVTLLEQRPPPSAPDLGPLDARVGALERRPAAAPVQPPDLASLEARVAALEQRQPPDLAPLRARIAALENRDRGEEGSLARRLDADEARLAALEKTAGHAAQVQAARIALDAGQKLGVIPGAPPALARFASENPPTEAQLRLAFPQAERAALAASRPDTEGKPLLARMWARAQDLVTIRQGDRVIVGDPTAGALARARSALEAGDLQGAAAAVSSLTGPPSQAMAGWLAQARALLDARAAFAAWAAQG